MNELLQALRLSRIEAELPALYEQARLHSLTFEAFLRRVLLLEIEGRKLTAQRNRLKAAHLPVRKTLEEFDFSFQPSIQPQQIWALAELSFVQTKTNIVFLGPPRGWENTPFDWACGQGARGRLQRVVHHPGPSGRRFGECAPSGSPQSPDAALSGRAGAHH